MGNILRGVSAYVFDITGIPCPGMPPTFSEYTPLGNHACSPESESRKVTFFSSLILTVGIAGVLQNKSLTDTLCGLLWRGNKGKKYCGMEAYLSLLGTMITCCVNRMLLVLYAGFLS